MTLLTESRERFLLAITAQVPADRVAEIHFFQPIRQGGVESGVAVVVERGPSPDASSRGSEDGDVSSRETTSEATGSEGSAFPEAEMSSRGTEESAFPAAVETAPSPAGDARIVVYTARYRHTLKGLDRGKWETSVVAEADAPLVAVDAVVRGVQRRAGDVDDATRMEGDEVRAFMSSRRPSATKPATT